MYHAIVRRNLRATFDNINKGTYAPIVRQFAATDVEHWFSGSSTLSGRRDDSKQIQEWYDRLSSVFPDLRFQINELIVSGWPWNTIAVVEWVDFVSDLEGNQYSNQGVHVIRLKWGRVTELHVYCDTELLSRICRTLGAQGNAAAVAPPIGQPVPFAAHRRSPDR